MSKYNFGGAKISAKNLHIGDIYNYHSPQDFLSKNNELKFSDIEKELVEIIFDNTSSEEERQSILESLKSINSNEGTYEEKRKSIFSFKPLLNLLKNSGLKIALDVTIKYLTEYATNHNLLSIIKELLK